MPSVWYKEINIYLLKSSLFSPPKFQGLPAHFFIEIIWSFTLKQISNQHKFYFSHFNEYFNPHFYGWDDYVLITTVLRKLCGTNSVAEMTKHSCDGFNVLPRNVCYPIPPKYHKKLFEEDEYAETMRLVNDAYMVHFYGRFSNSMRQFVNDQTPYVTLAKKYCPEVFKTIVDYF